MAILASASREVRRHCVYVKGSQHVYPEAVQTGPGCKYAALFHPSPAFDELRASFLFEVYGHGVHDVDVFLSHSIF